MKLYGGYSREGDSYVPRGRENITPQNPLMHAHDENDNDNVIHNLDIDSYELDCVTPTGIISLIIFH